MDKPDREVDVATPYNVIDVLFDHHEDGQIKKIRRGTEVMMNLIKQGFVHYKKAGGSPIKINDDNIVTIINDSINRAGLRLTTRRGRREPTTLESFESRQERLKEIFDLSNLYVLPKGGSGGSSSYYLGQLAAIAFGNIMKDYCDTSPTLAIGGGQTIQEMAWWLPVTQKQKLTVVPANFVTRLPEDKGFPGSPVYDSCNIANHVQGLFPASESGVLGVLPLPCSDSPKREDYIAAASYHRDNYDKNLGLRRVFARSLSPDIVFLGAGAFLDSSPTFHGIYRYLGITYNSLSSMKQPPVGDINLCFFDKDGNDLTNQVLADRLKALKVSEKALLNAESYFPEEPDCHPFLLAMNIRRMKHLVEEKKKVVVVAGGSGVKARALLALLRGKIINGLVTDAPTMDRLLELAEN